MSLNNTTDKTSKNQPVSTSPNKKNGTSSSNESRKSESATTTSNISTVTFRPSAIVRVSSFESIDSVDSDGISTPQSKSQTSAAALNREGMGVMVNQHQLQEQIPNSSLNMSGGSSSGGGGASGGSRVFSRNSTTNTNAPHVFQSKKYQERMLIQQQQQQQQLLLHATMMTSSMSLLPYSPVLPIMTKNVKTNSLSSFGSSSSCGAGTTAALLGRQGSVVPIENYVQPQALMLADGGDQNNINQARLRDLHHQSNAAVQAVSALIMSRIFAGNNDHNNNNNNRRSASSINEMISSSSPVSVEKPTTTVRVGSPPKSVSSPSNSTTNKSNNNVMNSSDSNNNNNNSVVAAAAASPPPQSIKMTFALTTLATISQEQQSVLEQAIGAAQSELVPELISLVKKSFEKIFDEGDVAPEASEHLTSRIGEMLRLIGVSNADVTLGTFKNNDDEEIKTKEKAPTSKSDQLTHLGNRLVEDILHEISIAETAKVRQRLLSNGVNGGGAESESNHHHAFKFHDKNNFNNDNNNNNNNNSGCEIQLSMPLPIPRQQTMIKRKSVTKNSLHPNSNDDDDDDQLESEHGEKEEEDDDACGSTFEEKEHNRGHQRAEKMQTTDAMSMLHEETCCYTSSTNNESDVKSNNQANIIESQNNLTPSPPRAPNTSRPQRQQQQHQTPSNHLNLSYIDEVNAPSSFSSSSFIPDSKATTARGGQNNTATSSTEQPHQNSNKNNNNGKHHNDESSIFFPNIELSSSSFQQQRQTSSNMNHHQQQSSTTTPSLGDLRGFRSAGGLHSSVANTTQIPGMMSRNPSNMTVAGREFSSFVTTTEGLDAGSVIVQASVTENNNNDHTKNNDTNLSQLQQQIQQLQLDLSAANEVAHFWKSQFGALTETMINSVLRVERVSAAQQAKTAAIFKSVSRERQFFPGSATAAITVTLLGQCQQNNHNTHEHRKPHKLDKKNSSKRRQEK